MRGMGIVVLLLLAGLVQAQPGHLIRASDLRAEPYSDAARVARLADHAPLNVLQRKGGWYQVKTQAAATGWVRMGAVRFANASTQTAESGWLNTGRSSARWSTATTGIRGLSEEDLQHAAPDMQAVHSLSQYQVSAAGASRFAAALKLRVQSVPFLPKD